MAISNNDIVLRVGFDLAKFGDELKKTNSQLTKWGSDISGTLKAVGLGFSALSIGRFVLDVSRLAGEAEGVSAAFNKLPNAVLLMNDLKAATGGTVSELELMKRSVMASNFDISLKALPELLEFATLRARQTGQSVNYLVDSIVTGIGRKSKLILDNLGISAVQLTEALGGASAASSTIGEVAEAVGKIASENLKKMGKLTEDAAVKADRLNASWQNMKVTIGGFVNTIGLSKAFKTLDEFLKRWDRIFSGTAGKVMDLRELELSVENFNKLSKSWSKDTYFSNLTKIEEGAKRLGVQITRLIGEHGQLLMITKNPITFIDATKTEEEVRHVKFLEEAIANLKEEMTLSTTNEQWEKYQKEIEAFQKELDKIQGKVEKIVDTMESFRKFSAEIALGPAKQSPALAGREGPTPVVGMPADKAIEQATKAIAKYVAVAKQAQDAFSADIIKQRADQAAQAWARFGDIVGESVGDMVNGTQTFAQAMAQMASKVLDTLFQLALGNAAWLASQFGPAAPFVFAASAGALKAIFSNIGHGNQTSGMATATGRAYGQQNRAVFGGGPIVTFRLAGKDLVGVLQNQNRFTTATGN